MKTFLGIVLYFGIIALFIGWYLRSCHMWDKASKRKP